LIAALIDFLRTLTNPEKLIELLATVFGGWQGYAFLAAILFAETGLLMGFILPGDSLLFTVGVVAGAGALNIFGIIAVLMFAVFFGDNLGYWLGRKAGISIFSRPNSKLFRREHLARTQHFYEKHGGKMLVYARFIPIVRTFAPFVAGVGRMDYARFISYSFLGSLAWVPVLTLIGYAIGGHPFVRAHFEKFVLGVVAVSLLPVAITVLRSRFSAKSNT
jgi:membrane-associated protein